MLGAIIIEAVDEFGDERYISIGAAEGSSLIALRSVAEPVIELGPGSFIGPGTPGLVLNE